LFVIAIAAWPAFLCQPHADTAGPAPFVSPHLNVTADRYDSHRFVMIIQRFLSLAIRRDPLTPPIPAARSDLITKY